MKKMDAPMHRVEGEEAPAHTPQGVPPAVKGVTSGQPDGQSKRKKTGIVSRLFRSLILSQDKHDIQ